ncbi:nitroreductase [Ancylobacter sp. 6x-1]|uniref:Putative NAD(P)H nitroreductase n=1 Tax=Ancylobacter crimeensis TaxID=2579147 RepID=A0ABT0DCQ9_9HYPH|nr:nitroreductase [Ancylobacter crimeensis]MCK0197737.1 nitroreductase [Ancylobacter crimeensis]
MNDHTTRHHGTGKPVEATAAPAPESLVPCPVMIERLATRRSPPLRSLGGPGPSAQELDLLLRLAIRTPDHGRLAPWRLIILEGEARAELGARLDALYARQNPEMAAGKSDMWQLYLMRAPLTVVLVSRPDRTAKVPEWNQALSAGAVGMALTIAASALGFVSQWLLKWPGRDPEAAALLGVGPQEKVAGFLHIGRPTQTTPDRPRPDLADVVSRWTP